MVPEQPSGEICYSVSLSSSLFTSLHVQLQDATCVLSTLCRVSVRKLGWICFLVGLWKMTAQINAHNSRHYQFCGSTYRFFFSLQGYHLEETFLDKTGVWVCVVDSESTGDTYMNKNKQQINAFFSWVGVKTVQRSCLFFSQCPSETRAHML